jgi:hypothetical protein
MKPIWNTLNIGLLALGLWGGYRSTEPGSLSHANADPMFLARHSLSHAVVLNRKRLLFDQTFREALFRVLHGIGIPSIGGLILSSPLFFRCASWRQWPSALHCDVHQLVR